MTTQRTWVRPESLAALIGYLSHLVLYELDPDELAAIRLGLIGTDDECEIWFTYSLEGKAGTIHFKLAHDAESPLVVHIEVRVPSSMDTQVATALSLAGSYVITDPRSRE